MKAYSGYEAMKNQRKDTKIVVANYTEDPLIDNGNTYSNKGASKAVIVTLAPALVGAKRSFVVEATQDLQIRPNGTEMICLTTGAVQAAGVGIQADLIGESLELECVEVGKWFVKNYIGDWVTFAATP